MTDDAIKILLWSTLSAGSFLQINKALIHELGLLPAVLLSDLISKERYFDEHNKLENGWFFNTVDNRGRDTGLSPHEQRIALKVCESKGLVQVEKRGMPAKNYFKLDHNSIISLVVKGSQWSKVSTTCGRKYRLHNNNNGTTPSKEGDSPTSLREVGSHLISLLNHWNSLSEVQKHKKPETKVYQKSILLLRQLTHGTFGRHNSIDKKFIKSHKIPLTALDKKYSVDEIKEGMNRLALYHRKGYWPGVDPNGKEAIITRIALPQALFNPETGSSLFMWVMNEKPEPSGRMVESRYPDILNRYEQELFNGSLSKRERSVLNRAVNMIGDFHTRSINKLQPVINHRSLDRVLGSAGNPDPFVTTHIEWARKKGDRLSPYTVYPSGDDWDDFMAHLKRKCGINLTTKPGSPEYQALLRGVQEESNWVKSRKESTRRGPKPNEI